MLASMKAAAEKAQEAASSKLTEAVNTYGAAAETDTQTPEGTPEVCIFQPCHRKPRVLEKPTSAYTSHSLSLRMHWRAHPGL